MNFSSRQIIPTNLPTNGPQMSFLAYLGNISSAYSTSKKRVICSDLPPGWQSIVSEPGWGTLQLKLSQTGLSFRLIYIDCLRRSRIRISLFSCCVIYWICIMPEGKHWPERIGGWGNYWKNWCKTRVTFGSPLFIYANKLAPKHTPAIPSSALGNKLAPNRAPTQPSSHLGNL